MNKSKGSFIMMKYNNGIAQQQYLTFSIPG